MAIAESLYRAPNGLNAPRPGAMPMEVEVPGPALPAGEMLPDGGMVFDFDKKAEGPAEIDFDANLAEHMDQTDLAMLSADLITLFEADDRSRKDWKDAYEKGLNLLGMRMEERTEPWDGACGVFHPILSEAIIRFQAQTIMEVFPAAGPVRVQIVGKETPDKTKQGRRVEQYMNYLLTERMPEYRAEMERLLFAMPLAGSAFKKVYPDPNLGRPVAMFVAAADFVVSYGASDLDSAQRYTHIMRRSPNEIKKMQRAGFYREVDLPTPTPVFSSISEKESKLTGERPSVEVDDRHTLLEMHVDRNLKGFEDKDGGGEETGIALPYVITLEKASGLVLAIRRNWDEKDPAKVRKPWFVHYPYVPGMGFYGFGLIHIVGSIAKAATSALRQLIDSGTMANLQAGFKTKGLRIKGDNKPFSPGEFRDVDVASGVIRDNIMFLPFKEPSVVLMQLLQYIVEEGRRLASIADLKISDMSAQAPVGTTLALLERSMKLQSAIQSRIHAALRRELKIMVDVIKNYTPPAYEYEVEEGSEIKAQDFDDKIDVLPVSDPNASTMSQRIIQHQASLQLAETSPQIYDMAELHRQFQDALGTKDIEKIIPDQKDIKPADPIAENMAILNQKPVKAFLWQDHKAHITVHKAAAEDPKIIAMLENSPAAQAIAAAMDAHVREHMAFDYRAEIEKQLGVPMPDPEQPLPQEAEVQLSKLVADAADRVLKKDIKEQQQIEIMEKLRDPVVQMQERELDIKEADLQRKAKADETNADLKNRQMIADLTARLLELQAQVEEAEGRRSIDAAALAADKVIEGAQIEEDRKKTVLQTSVDMSKMMIDADIRQQEVDVKKKIAAKPVPKPAKK